MGSAAFRTHWIYAAFSKILRDLAKRDLPKRLPMSSSLRKMTTSSSVTFTVSTYCWIARLIDLHGCISFMLTSGHLFPQYQPKPASPMPCGCAFTSSYTCSYLNILLAMTKVTIDTSWYNLFRCCDCQHTVDMDIITEKTRDCEQGVLVLFLSTEMSYG